MFSTLKLFSVATVALVACAPFSVHASPSADLHVMTTMAPSSCAPAISNNGVIDYGNISSGILKRGGPTLLVEKQLSFTINCLAPTKLKLQATDNRADSMIPGLLWNTELRDTGGGDLYNFGLGMSGGKPFGGYAFSLSKTKVTIDGNRGFEIISDDLGATWKASNLGNISKTGTYSWSNTSGGAPTAFRQLSGNVSVRAAIINVEVLDLKQEIELDGSATLTITYL